MKLEDFEEASTSTFEDFETDDATVIPNTALKSIKNRAASCLERSPDWSLSYG